MADGREAAAPAETDAVLRDGSIIHPSRSSSGRPSGLVAFYESLSLQSLYFRFFGGIATFGHLVDRWLERDRGCPLPEGRGDPDGHPG